MFGRSHDDPAIEGELEALLRSHDFGQDGDDVSVPAALLLAIILRPRCKGQGRGRPRQEIWLSRWNRLVVRNASTGWAKRVAAGEDSKRAKHAAAIEAAKRIHGHSLSVTTIEMRMRRKRK